jgi:hypothetical protein
MFPLKKEKLICWLKDKEKLNTEQLIELAPDLMNFGIDNNNL